MLKKNFKITSRIPLLKNKTNYDSQPPMSGAGIGGSAAASQPSPAATGTAVS